MGIITKEVEIKVNGSNVEHYKELGYQIPMKKASARYCRATGKEFVYDFSKSIVVKVEDLPACSAALVDTVCDYCGEPKPPIRYVDYNAETKNGATKCCCLSCASLKRKEVMIEKYGYEYAFQVPELKKKIQDTNMEKYGSVSPSGNAEVREKQKKTNLEKYGVEYPSQRKEVQDKMKRTNLERYGVENVLYNQEIKDKISQTIFERYGVENVSQNQDIKDKKKQTMIERYDVAYPLQSKEFFEKMKQTNMERYGTEFAILSDNIKQKTKETFIEKYGVDNPFKNEEVQEKAKKTNLEKYGVECLLSLPSFHENSRVVDFERYGVYHHLQNPEILAKQKETLFQNGTCPTSKQQKFLHQLYGGELNYPLKMYNLDIYLPNERIDIEFDGSGHALCVKLGTLTQKEFDRKEIIRNSVIKKEKIKQMRIISDDDKLPSDSILIQMLSDARSYFAQYPDHNWIEFNISTSTVRNAEDKDGLPYSFGSLRTIKDSDINIVEDNGFSTNNN